MARWFRVQSIGTVRRPHDPGGDSGGFFDPAIPAKIEVDARWEDGLRGIEEYSHLVILFYLDRATRRRASGHPRTAEGHADLPLVGFFGMRTPKRPNPLGLACPRLLAREGRMLSVQGFDAWDGTPVLDIKGYSPRDELRPDATVPDWLTSLWERHDAERVVAFRPWESASTSS
ncbi:MAG: SAM-dependent methyltransferase [Planctomycetaceae bacterium]